MVTQVWRRSGDVMVCRGRPTDPVVYPASRDRIVSVTASYAGLPPDPFVLGTTKPDATNTGPRISFGSAEVVNGTGGKITYSTNNQVITGKIFNCQVFVTASNVTFRDCWFFGSTTLKYLGAGLLDCKNASCINCVVEFCEFTAYSGGVDRTRFWLAGLVGKEFHAYRCNFHDVMDGLDPDGANWSVKGCYIHDFAFRSDDADHANDIMQPYWTHADGVQPASGNNFAIDGNNIEMTFSTVSGMIGDPSAPSIASDGTVTAGNHGAPDPGDYPNAHGILLAPRNGHINNGLVSRNWFSDGTYCVQIGTQGRGYDTGNDCVFSGNRLYVGQTPYSTQLPAQIVYTTSVGTFTGIETTIYAEDDMNVTAPWRGHRIQAPTGNLTYRYNSTLTP